MAITAAWPLVKEAAKNWKEDRADRLAAALAFYTLLSIAPLVVITIAAVGAIFGEQAARGEVAAQLGSVVGVQAAQGVQSVVAHAQSPRAGLWSTVLGVTTLLVGASGVFAELQSALDTIWRVSPKPGRGIAGIVRDRLFSFTMVLGVAFLLLVSLVLSTAVAAIGKFLASSLPGGEALWHLINIGISFGIIALLFALIYRLVPDVKIRWRDVWAGAAATALAFTIGKFFLGLYLGKTSFASSYGAAGSIVVLVVWVYYSAQILFFGAEFTRVQSLRRGSRMAPSSNAVSVDHGQQEARAI